MFIAAAVRVRTAPARGLLSGSISSFASSRLHTTNLSGNSLPGRVLTLRALHYILDDIRSFLVIENLATIGADFARILKPVTKSTTEV
jgi:hypothetical protein